MERGPRFTPEQHERPRLRMEAATRASEKHPKRNDDVYFMAPELGVAGLCDGAGGVSGGGIAARLAVEAMHERMKQVSHHPDKQELLFLMLEAFTDAHRSIQMHQKQNKAHHEMCTTGVLSQVWWHGNERHVMVGHVGDSRAYMRHPDSHLETITLDDSRLLHEFADIGNGRIDKGFAWRTQEKLENAVNDHDFSFEDREIFGSPSAIDVDNPSQLIGYQSFKAPHVRDFIFPAGAQLMLASDGLQNLTRDEIAALYNQNAADPARAIQTIVEQAHKRSLERGFRSHPDDISALVIE